MKIAVLSCFHPYRGGIAQFNANLFLELGKGHDIRAFNFKRQYPDFLFPGRTQYVTPEDKAVSIESTALLDTVNPFSYARTAREIRAWDPDILVLRYWMTFFAPSLGYVARHMSEKCKVVAILDNVIPHERHFFDRMFTRYFLSGVDGCITLCDEVAGDLADIRNDLPHRTMPHPVYTQFGEPVPRDEACARLGLDPEKKTILFFGLIREYKGLDILINAFDLLDDSYQLVIAGEPYGSFEPYRKLLDNNSGKDRIHTFLNYIKDDEVSSFFSAADTAVLPYRSATQSGISNIANHFALPQIVTDVGGLKETIAGRGTGIVCNECEPGSVAGAIRLFFSDPSVRQDISDGIKRENEKYTWSNFAGQLINFAETLTK